MLVAPEAMLAQVAALAGRALLEPKAVAKAREVCLALPEFSHCACLECPLDTCGEDADLLVCVPARARALLSDVAAERPAWSNVRGFAESWSSASLPFLSQVPFIWLEFDLPRGRPAPPEPLLFCCLQPDFLQDPISYGDLASPGRSRLAARANVAATLRTVAELPEAVRACLDSCLNAIPADGYALHVASLTPRGIAAVRLVLTIPVVSLRSYLSAIGWPGDFRELKKSLLSLGVVSGRFGIQLDVGHSVGATLGLQFHRSHRDPSWPPLLQRFVGSGLCSASRAQHLLQWLGDGLGVLPNRRFPVSIRRELELKVQHTTGVPDRGKAYLGFGCDFRLI